MEINALARHLMTMQNWIDELDSILKITRKDILKGSRKFMKLYDIDLDNIEIAILILMIH